MTHCLKIDQPVPRVRVPVWLSAQAQEAEKCSFGSVTSCHPTPSTIHTAERFSLFEPHLLLMQSGPKGGLLLMSIRQPGILVVRT